MFLSAMSEAQQVQNADARRFRPYAFYKPSGVEWLGAVPEHWEVRRMRNVVDMRVSNVDKHTKEGELLVRLCNYADVYKNDRITGRVSFMWATATTDEIERFRLELDDVLITKDSEVWNEIGIPALVEYAAEDLVCSYHLALLRPREVLLRGGYLLRALQSSVVAWQFHVAANGVTRYGLTHDAIKSVLLLVPPLPEQSAIVRYLDHVDRRIQRYIRAKEKLIKLLEEQKQALIHRGVTGQVDVRTGRPYPGYKPSGVEWLGEVPEHWEVGPLKRFVVRWSGAIKAGPFGSQLTAAEMMEADVKVYTQRNVIDRNLGEGTNYISNAKFEVLRTFEVFPGDVLVTSRGTIGRTMLVTKDCERGILHPCLIRIQPDQELLIGEFLMTLIRDSQLLPQQLAFLSNATTIDVIYSDTLANIVVPVPLTPEQTAIVRYLDKATSDIDAAMDRTRRQIELLSEYRTRLIADVVTGKLDVRETAAELPDKAEESKSLDDTEALINGEAESTDDLDAARKETEA